MNAIVAQARKIVAGMDGGWVQNLAITGGGVALCHGLGRVYAPAGEIAAGTLLLGLAWLLARAQRR